MNWDDFSCWAEFGTAIATESAIVALVISFWTAVVYSCRACSAFSALLEFVAVVGLIALCFYCSRRRSSQSGEEEGGYVGTKEPINS